MKFGGDYSLSDAAFEAADELSQYTWEFDMRERYEPELNLPLTDIPCRFLELSTFENYQIVADRLTGIWEQDQSFDWEAVSLEIGFQEQDSLETKIEAAVAWVLDNFRYQAIAVGELGTVPAPLSEVFARRFGDCKEKSFLLVQVLRKLGLEAWPALVSTIYLEKLIQRLPGQNFDHAIACFEFKGELHWVDATNAYTSRKIERFRRSSFGWALLLKAGTKDLVEVKAFEPRDHDVETEMVARLDDRNFSGEVEYRYHSKGSAAEFWKRRLLLEGKDELRNTFSDFMTDLYGPLQMADDFEVVTERYEDFSMRFSFRSDNLTFFDEGNRKHVFPAVGLVIANTLGPRFVEFSQRESAYSLPYPFTVKERIVIHNSIFEKDEVETLRINNGFFRAQKGAKAIAGQVEVISEFESLRPEIPAQDCNRLKQDIHNIEEYLVPDIMFVNAGGRRKRVSRSSSSSSSEFRRIEKRERVSEPVTHRARKTFRYEDERAGRINSTSARKNQRPSGLQFDFWNRWLPLCDSCNFSNPIGTHCPRQN